MHLDSAFADTQSDGDGDDGCDGGDVLSFGCIKIARCLHFADPSFFKLGSPKCRRNGPPRTSLPGFQLPYLILSVFASAPYLLSEVL